MSQAQSDRQASIRAVTGTAYDVIGDWHALFNMANIPQGDFNGRLLAWLNQQMASSYPDLNGAQQAYAIRNGAAVWESLGALSLGPIDLADFTTAAMPSGLTYAGQNGTFYNSAGVLTAAAANQPRFDYDPATAVRNYVPYSEDFSQWTPGNGAPAAVSAGTAPDGVSQMWTLTDPSTTQQSRYSITYSGLTAGQSYIFFLSVMKGSAGQAMQANVDGTRFTNYNLSNNVQQGFNGASGIGRVDMGTYWILYFVFTAANATATVNIYPDVSMGGVAFGDLTNAATGSITAWGAQISDGTALVRYVKTGATARTDCLIRGLLIEETRTSSFLSSLAPATQTITLGTGKYTVWCNGPPGASVIVAAGTAVGTGFGTATAGTVGTYGTWDTFTVTTAGTVTVTMGSTAPTSVQCENGAYPTSMIVTAGAPVTRSMDSVSQTGGLSYYNLSASSVYSEYVLPYNVTNQKVFTYSPTANEGNLVRVTSQSTFTEAQVISSAGGIALNASLPLAAPYAISKAALAYDATGAAAVFNGGTPVTSSAGYLPQNINSLYVGRRGTSLTQALNGWIRKRAYYNTRLPNSQLQTITGAGGSIV